MSNKVVRWKLIVLEKTWTFVTYLKQNLAGIIGWFPDGNQLFERFHVWEALDLP